eukprot:TRINITY_DN31250_c0_g1_i1.p1 TRINITY_DN31250_c0_g1~~TRINITY_DN31250_c0_g1_i1.p1  ORF type:complete len:281 (+),score=48.81 TRINITY_DN31250_c0_g1_i1:68-844(+)
MKNIVAGISWYSALLAGALYLTYLFFTSGFFDRVWLLLGGRRGFLRLRRRVRTRRLASSSFSPAQYDSLPRQGPYFLRLPTKKKVLILDLDETLVHASLGPIHPRLLSYTLKLQIDQETLWFHVSERPHVRMFLREAAKWYSVVIFTASVAQYANPVIDSLDPDNSFIARRYFRSSCLRMGDKYVKDISLVEKDLSRCVIVDNSPASYSIHEHNAIPIPPYDATSPFDEDLLTVLPLLQTLAYVEDVRHVLSLRKLLA